MVVAEALAHGTPVLARDTGGMRTFDLDSCGRVLDAHAGPEIWEAAVLNLLAHRPSYDRMSSHAHRYAANTLTWENWARRIETIVRARLDKKNVERAA